MSTQLDRPPKQYIPKHSIQRQEQTGIGSKVAREPRAIGHSLALILLCATLPLQWQVVSNTGIGIVRYFHIPAVLFVATFLTGGAVGRVVKGSCIVVAAWIFTALTLSRVLFAWYHSDLQAVANYLQEYFYACIGFFVAALVADLTIRRRVRRTLLWAGPAATASFVIFFSFSMQSAGIDAISTFRDALIRADPNILNFALFKVTFSHASETSANARHEIFGAIVACNLLSLWALDMVRPRPVMRRTVWAFALFALALTMLSLSRAVVLAILIAILLPAMRFVLAKGMKVKWQQTLVALVMLVLAWPTWGLVKNRFLTDTGSYEARMDSMSQVVTSIGESPLLGGPSTGVTAHNIILDSASTSGILSGLMATAFVLYVTYLLLRNFGRYLNKASLISWVGLAAGIMPLVRMFTGGAGLLQVGQWVSLGVFLGIYRAVPKATRAMRE